MKTFWNPFENIQKSLGKHGKQDDRTAGLFLVHFTLCDQSINEWIADMCNTDAIAPKKPRNGIFHKF